MTDTLPATNQQTAVVHFTEQQLQTIRNTLVPPEITPAQFQLFIHICQHLQLDPFKRQVAALPFRHTRSDAEPRLIVHTTIDGYRAISARSGRYQGIAYERCLVSVSGTDTDSTITPDQFNPKRHTLISATVALSITGFDNPVAATALWDAYCPTYDGKPSGVWLKHPLTMLLKCAEALAHRKASLTDLSGIYVTEEIQHMLADSQQNLTPSSASPQPSPPPRQRTPRSKPPATPDTLNDCWRSVADYIESTAPDPDTALAAAIKFIETAHHPMDTAEDTPETRAQFMQFARTDLLAHLRAQGLIRARGA